MIRASGTSYVNKGVLLMGSLEPLESAFAQVCALAPARSVNTVDDDGRLKDRNYSARVWVLLKRTASPAPATQCTKPSVAARDASLLVFTVAASRLS